MDKYPVTELIAAFWFVCTIACTISLGSLVKSLYKGTLIPNKLWLIVATVVGMGISIYTFLIFAPILIWPDPHAELLSVAYWLTPPLGSLLVVCSWIVSKDVGIQLRHIVSSMYKDVRYVNKD